MYILFKNSRLDYQRDQFFEIIYSKFLELYFEKLSNIQIILDEIAIFNISKKNISNV